jgi:hypothetical protein
MQTKIIPDNEESLDDLVVRARKDSQLKKWMQNQEKPNTLEFEKLFEADIEETAIHSLCVAPDDSYIAYVADNYLHIRRIDCEKKHLGSVDIWKKAYGIDFYPSTVMHDEGQMFVLAVVDQEGMQINYFNDQHIESGKKLSGNPLSKVAFNVDGSKIAFGDEKRIDVYDLNFYHMSLGICWLTKQRKINAIKDVVFPSLTKLYVGYNRDLDAYEITDIGKSETVIQRGMDKVVELSRDKLNRHLAVVEYLDYKDQFNLNIYEVEHLNTRKPPRTLQTASAAAFGKDILVASYGGKITVYKLNYENYRL